MKELTVKLEDDVLNVLDEISQKLHKPLSEIISEALVEYKKSLEKKQIYKKMESLADLLSKDKEYIEDLKEIEALSGDIIE